MAKSKASIGKIILCVLLIFLVVGGVLIGSIAIGRGINFETKGPDNQAQDTEDDNLTTPVIYDIPAGTVITFNDTLSPLNSRDGVNTDEVKTTRINIKGTASYVGVPLEPGTYTPNGAVSNILYYPNDIPVFEILRGSVDWSNLSSRYPADFSFVFTNRFLEYEKYFGGYFPEYERPDPQPDDTNRFKLLDICYEVYDEGGSTDYNAYCSVTIDEPTVVSSAIYRNITNTVGDTIQLSEVDGVALYTYLDMSKVCESLLYCNSNFGLCAAITYGNWNSTLTSAWKGDFSKSITLTEGYNFESEEIKQWLLANTDLSL